MTSVEPEGPEGRRSPPAPELPADDAPRRVLVTGGAGFIGGHVAEAYLRQGDHVWVVDDLSSGQEENLPEGATFVRMDVADPALRELFREVRFDLVNHHAAQIDVRMSVSEPARDAQTNILGLLNVLEGAREVGTARFIHISSGGVVYGEPEERPTPESAPKRPLSPYGVSKLTGEYYLDYYRVVHGLDPVTLRYSNVYGPRQDPHGEAGVVAIFSKRLLAGEELLVFGDGEQTRDYVYVEDVVRANLLAADVRLPDRAGIDARAFNVGTGVETSVNRLADTLEGVAGRRPGRSYRAPRKGELRNSALDASRIQELGWSPRHSLADGLRETFRYIERQSQTSARTPESTE
ncbi:MAG: NAD-dependent epimerase/dehydratase family protein [Gemmatimonadales bacterium]|nr:MAG: NAD-dependent epimerase/dehydratase family protein [Gemmatimonadales bacterium]